MSLDSLAAVLESVANDAEPPPATPVALQALWLAKKGEWHRSHDLVDGIDTPLGAWIHAHLHVLEGDLSNAEYWYRRAGRRSRSPQEAAAEWEEMVKSIVGGEHSDPERSPN